jgi:hypothetical protein
MGNLYYNYRDILKAPRLALMGKNIFLMMFHIMTGYLVYLILTYLAMLIDGGSIKLTWRIYQLFPFGPLEYGNTWAKFIWYLGSVFWIAMFLRGSLGVARSSFEELRGNFFFSSGEAMRFIRKNSRIVYRAVIGVLLFIAFLIILGLVVGLIAKIPVVGELFYGFFYDFPFFVVSLFAVLVIFLLATLFLTGPAVVAIKGEDAMTTLFDGFSAITSQPLRWTMYLGGSVVLAKFSTFVLTYASFRAMQFTNWTTGIIMGDKQIDLFARGAADIFDRFPYTDFFTSLIPGISINLDNYFDLYTSADMSWSMSLGSIFIMISILFILFFIISYFLNTLVCAQVIAFLDIRNATHQEKLAVIPEDELTQELNPGNTGNKSPSAENPE